MVNMYSTGNLCIEGIRYPDALNPILRPKASGICVTEMMVVYNGRPSNMYIVHAL
jgi:hypothetical protein